jgi:hypothetical protein
VYLFLFVWYLVNRKFKTKAPLVAFFVPFSMGMIPILAFQEKLPAALSEDLQEEDLVNLAGLVVFTVMNYNSFRLTILIKPPLILILYYLQLISQAPKMYDPYTSKKFDDSAQTWFIEMRMFHMFLFVIVCSIRHYLFYRDCAIIEIEKYMVSLQQTQLRIHFEESQDPIIIASNEKTEEDKDVILLSNKIA